VPVSLGGGDVAVGDWTEVVKRACGPWISQKCPSDISVSAMKDDDQRQGQLALARVALAVGPIHMRLDNVLPTIQPLLLHHKTTLTTVGNIGQSNFIGIFKSLSKSNPCSSHLPKLC